jgi:hypothetical protein
LARSRIADKSVEVQQAIHVEELEEANAQLCVEPNAAQLKLAEVKCCELALTSTYGDLKK